MSLTRRNWFVHRVLPTGALLGAAAAEAGPLAAAAAAADKPKAPAVIKAKSKIEKTERAHPFLQAAAQQDPDRLTSVIVHKKKNLRNQGGHGDDIARGIGGRRVGEDDIDFINTVELELPLKKVLQLAKHPKVAFVSPNPRVKFQAINAANLRTTHLQTLGIPNLWNGTNNLSGAGVTVAVLDSGIKEGHPDLPISSTNVTPILINPRATGRKDQNGHGTHVIGIITGKDPYGRYMGVAPDSRVLSIQIADDEGRSRESDLIRALKWVNQYRKLHNIKAVNLSVNGSVRTSYLTSPIAAAVESLMMAGVTVVVAAGNRGTVSEAVQFAPANDPFVITVGALDNNDSVITTDDSLAPFSSRGLTLDGHAKPEVVAPGRKIVAPLASRYATLAEQFPDRIVDTNYIRLSGTSMSAPVVTGIVALLLQKYPNLTANQVKWLVTNTMRSYPGQVGAAGLIDPAAMFARAALGGVPQANQNIPFNNTVQDAVDGMSSTSSYWDSSYWDSSYWDSSYWDSSYWDSSYWDSAAFESAEFETFPDE